MESQVKLIPIHMGPHLLGLVQRERNPKKLRANSTETSALGFYLFVYLFMIPKYYLLI